VEPATTNSYISNLSGIDNDRFRMRIEGNLIMNAYNGSRNYPLAAMRNENHRIDINGILIKAAGSTGYVRRIHIHNNVIKNIGFKSSGGQQGKRSPNDWVAKAHAIWMRGALEVHVTNNTMSHTLSGGINFGGCRDVLVKDNTISHTGLSRIYREDARLVSDGITAYKNRATIYSGLYASRPENFRIFGNTITNSWNNGIHTSGNSVTIKDNTVTGQMFAAIYHGHIARNSKGEIIEVDPMVNVSIKGNQVTRGRSTRPEGQRRVFLRKPSGHRNVQVKWNRNL
ncbi:MAG: right-handed parallel beta-helix repeat-containing protein, partial [Pseudomonadota bacterium]